MSDIVTTRVNGSERVHVYVCMPTYVMSVNLVVWDYESEYVYKSESKQLNEEEKNEGERHDVNGDLKKKKERNVVIGDTEEQMTK